MPLDPATSTIIATSVTGLFVTLLNYFREARAHRWAVEQSQRDREERERIAAEVKASHVAVAATLAQTTQDTATALGQKIDANTEINVKALDVANNVNDKLVAIGEARLRGTEHDRGDKA